MFSERDPYKSMGLDPKAPANGLRKIRHKSNPGEKDNNSASSTCAHCNQPFSLLESNDVNYCNECASLQIECLECGKKFIPKDNSIYCHSCERKWHDNSKKEDNSLKEKIESDFNAKIDNIESIDFKKDEKIKESEWDNPLNCFEPDDNRPKREVTVKQRNSGKKLNETLSNRGKIGSNSDNKNKNCLNKSDPEKLGQIRNEYKISISNIIFYCIYESTILLDIQDIVDILKGSKSRKILTLALDELSIYSELSHCSEEWLKDYIYELVSQNYLQIKYNSDKEVLILNEKSFDLLFHKFNSNNFKMLKNREKESKSKNSKSNFNHHISDEDLVYKLLNSPNGPERAHIAYLLGETKDSQYVEVLCKSTLDKDGNVRRLSASALEKIGDKKAEDTLINLLNDEKPQVRQYAAKALYKLGSTKSLEPLKLISDDPKPYVRKSVKRTLKKLSRI